MAKPELITLSLGGGVQSSTITEMIIEGDLPRPDLIIFADTGNEPDHVYRQLDQLDSGLKLIGSKIEYVTAGDMVADIYKNGRFAAIPLFVLQNIPIEGYGIKAVKTKRGRQKRQCTREYKITPIERRIRLELLDRGLARQQKDGRIYINAGVMVESWLGISTDEAERIKPSRTKWIEHRYPLIDLRMSRRDCINWLDDHGRPVPNKSSCKICPYHDDRYYAEMDLNELAEVVEFDRDLRNGRLRLSENMNVQLFLHQRCIPLDQIDFNGKDNGQLTFNFCDAGYCWT